TASRSVVQGSVDRVRILIILHVRSLQIGWAVAIPVRLGVLASHSFQPTECSLVRRSTILAMLWLAAAAPAHRAPSVARRWNEALLGAMRVDLARPTVTARNLFHFSIAVYDAWAAYDGEATPYLLGKTVGGFHCAFSGIPAPADTLAAREQAISYAAYRV